MVFLVSLSALTMSLLTCSYSVKNDVAAVVKLSSRSVCSKDSYGHPNCS
jgi:hypothetical protein